MPTIRIYFRNDKINKEGLAPIHFRISINRKSTFVSSGIAIPVKYWDEKNRRVKPGYPNAAKINHLLYKRLEDATHKLLERQTQNKYVTVRTLSKSIKGQDMPGFFKLAAIVLERTKADGKISTYDLRNSIIEKFQMYLNRHEIELVDINPGLLQKYESHLQQVHKNSPNTRHRDFKFLKQVYNEGYRLGYLNGQPNPFDQYKIKQVVTTKEYLNETEIQKIEDLDLSSFPRLELYKQLFVFTCTAYGIRISDLILMQRDDIKDGRINLKTQKTKHQLDVKLPQKALDIINWFQSHKRLTRFVFGLAPDNLDLQNNVVVDKVVSRETAKYNKALKEIGIRAGISKPISSHIGRHTWATRALRKGLDIYQVSILLTHANVKQTQVYAKIVSEQLDEASKLF